MPSPVRLLTGMGRATYTTPAGGNPPWGVAAMDIALRASPSLGRILRRIGGRFLLEGLPPMLAHYPDRVFLIPAGDTMYAHVFLKGEYEPSCSQLVRAWLREGDHAVDVGANHGWYSLLMAATVGTTGTVVAFEPMPESIDAWRDNFSLNRHLTADLRTVALGDTAGEVSLHRFAGLPHGHASLSTLGRVDFDSTQVRVNRLDIELGPGTQPALVKLDVEGSELAVLKGSEGLLTALGPPSWLIEVNYDTCRALGYEPSAIHDLLMGAHRYELYRVVERGIQRELRVADAPQGSTWFFVNEQDRGRLSSVRVL